MQLRLVAWAYHMMLLRVMSLTMSPETLRACIEPASWKRWEPVQGDGFILNSPFLSDTVLKLKKANSFQSPFGDVDVAFAAVHLEKVGMLQFCETAKL